jgi:hypothetical protein
MAGLGVSGCGCRLTARIATVLTFFAAVSLLAMGFAAAWGGAALAAQDAPASHDETTPTLHVYTNSIQIPALVLDPSRERIAKPIAGERFSVSIDSGPWFRATHVRLEGDDPLSLSILLDMRGGAVDFMPQLEDVIADLAPSTLHAKDHVSIFALGCDLMQSLKDAPADAPQLKAGVERAFAFWNTQKNITCLQEDHLWDALAYLAGQLYQLPGRRVILAVSQGWDRGSKHTLDQTTGYLQDTGVAVFGMSHSTPSPLRIEPVKVDPFHFVCESSGGMVFRATIPSFAETMKTFVTTLRERYIVEFPRPSNATPGAHAMRVKIAHGDADFIRAAGISVPLPDPAMLADPTTVSTGPRDAPKMGDRPTLNRPR